MTQLNIVMALIASGLVSACASSGENEGPPPIEVLDAEFTERPERERLRYFREVGALDALNEQGLSGRGVSVSIMGELVDATHQDLAASVTAQYNTYSSRDVVEPGIGNAPFGEENLQLNDGHGTHIAGTIAAACDGIGVQGLACGSTLDVYALGAYDDPDRWPSRGWSGIDELERFIIAFTTAMNALADRGTSRIATGSFNLESPALRYRKEGAFAGQSISAMIAMLDQAIDDDDRIDEIFAEELARFVDPADRSYLGDVVASNDNDASIALMSLIPLTSSWTDLERAIARYQSTDAVYIVTESNYDFEGRSSTLNAMPSLGTVVDEDLWLSVVMAVPTGLDDLDENSSEEDLDMAMAGGYETPLNSCGAMAADYCILTPSYSVLSTMTKRVAFQDASPLYEVEGRYYQSLDGHSMGAPMIAATLALMEELNVREGYGYTMKDLVRMLKESARRDFTGYDAALHGVGLLDVDAAIEAMTP